MPLKSYNAGRRLLPKTDTSSKIVTGQSELAYHISESFSTKVQDAYITFKYYRYGAYMGLTRFYWHDISAGTLSELTVVSSNGNTYSSGFSAGTQHHTNINQTWLTATIDMSGYESTGWGRFVVYHVTSSNTSSFYVGDFQMDHVEIHAANGVSHDLDPDLYRQNNGNQYWQRSTNFNTSWSTSHSWTDVSLGTDVSALWNYDAGGTPSTNTADDSNSDGSTTEYYLYTEVSGAENRYSYLQTKYQYDMFSGASQ